MKKEIKFVLLSFIVWRIALFLILFLSLKFIPLQKNFLGGGMTNYLKMPWFWAWANFDGEHYLSIAQSGYGFGEHAFFPLYPLLIRLIGQTVGSSMFTLNMIGILISNLSFLAALFGLYRLLRIDFSDRITKLAIIVLLLFPVSFYFASVYTESMFLALVVWSFYFARKGNWISASILGGFASATRVIGVLLFPALLYEYFNALRPQKSWSYKALWLLLIPLGLVVYMYYLKVNAGDYLGFLHSLPSFGEQRSATPILLPQVFYRYIFKILPNLNYSYFPVVFTTLLEFIVGVSFLFISLLSFFRLRLGYSLFLTIGYFTPTLSGSFSSLPRYILILFPAFILLSVYIGKSSKILQVIIFTLLFMCLVISTAMFIRGYWVS